MHNAMKANKSYNVHLLITALLLLRFALLWIGYDRLPYLPTVTDEVIVNDAAVSLSRGDGFVAKSFAGDWMGLDKVFYHFPPVFPVLQSIIFSLFGLSAFTLRFLNIFSQMLYLLLFLYVLYRLKASNILDKFAVTAIASLMLLEPITLFMARQARMDMLVVLFGISSLATLLYFNSLGKCPFWGWLLSGLLVGLSLSTHPESSPFFAVFLVIALFNYKQLRWWRCAILFLLPILVFASIWGLTYRSGSIPAFISSMKLSKSLLNVFGMHYFFDPRQYHYFGGCALLLTLISWAAITLRFINAVYLKRYVSQKWFLWLSIVLMYSVGHVIILQFFTPGIGLARISVVFPLALLGLGVAVAHLSNKIRRILLAAVLIIVLLELGCLGVYFNTLRQEWAIRDPARFDSIVESLPPAKKVAADPRLWYSFARHNYPVRLFCDVIDPPGWKEDKNYWLSNPETLNNFDIIILDSAHPLLESKIAAQKKHNFFMAQGRQFVVLSDQ